MTMDEFYAPEPKQDHRAIAAALERTRQVLLNQGLEVHLSGPAGCVCSWYCAADIQYVAIRQGDQILHLPATKVRYVETPGNAELLRRL